MLALATWIFTYTSCVSRKRGATAGPNPWHARTLEWTIPSPPPEYNFAKLPIVSSRYPLWEGNEEDLESARINSQEGKSADEMGIILPYPTIKPLIVAAGLVIMFGGRLTTKAWIVIVGAMTV